MAINNNNNNNNNNTRRSSGSATFPSFTTPTGAITTMTSTTGTITTLTSATGTIANLYSNIWSINNGNALRSSNDLFNVSASPTTENYLYYNNSSVFGHINTSNSALLWFINSSGSASFPSLNIGVSSISTLAVGSPSIWGSGDLLTVSVTPTDNYIYLNNSGALGGYNLTGNPSFFLGWLKCQGWDLFEVLVH